MKYILYFLISTLLLLPQLSLANILCSSDGYTIATINGVFTDDSDARKNMQKLRDKFGEVYQEQVVDYQYLLNPPHLGGLWDIVKSIYQGIFDSETIEDYDLVEMLLAASEKVKTQKLLLVAHSQGNFYANSFYDTVAGKVGGVPEESIGVYAVATPASRVAGDGKWLTSDTDAVIAKVVGRLPFKKILAPNTHIELSSGDDPLGHKFNEIYLKYRRNQIVSDIKDSLGKLAANDVQKENEPCLLPPELTRAHKVEGIVFSVIDPLATTGGKAIVATITGVYQTGKFVTEAAANIASTFYSVLGLPSPNADLNTGAENLAAVAGVLEKEPEQNVNQITPTPVSLQQNAASEILPAELNANDNVKSPETNNSTPAEPPGPIAPPPIIIVPPSGAPTPYQPGFGGDGGASSLVVSSNTASQNTVSSTSPPLISSPADLSVFATTTVTFTGTASSTSVISSDFSSATTSESGGAWSMAFLLPQGTTTINFYGNAPSLSTSSPTAISVFVDTVSPNVSASVSECSYSLTTSGCLLGSGSVTFNPTSTSTDISYYKIVKDGSEFGTTTASSVSVSLTEGTHTLEAVAYDRAGNAATSTESSVQYFSSPVVINEVAWAGTAASSFDEWLELYNRTSSAVDMSKLALLADDGVPYLPLSGTLASGGYYLVERGNDNTISNVTADLVVPFSGLSAGSGLSNDGEILSLVHYTGNASTTLDQTPSLSSCGNAWCGGISSTYRSMERKNPSSGGTSSSNWTSNDTYFKNGLDSAGGNVNGTPKSRNSQNLLSVGYYCPPYSSTFIEGSYYITTSGNNCVYLSSGFSGARYGDLYRGAVASSTLINGHSLSNNMESSQNNDAVSSPVSGENFFTAIYEIHDQSTDVNNFRSFFQTGASSPPHLNYGILNWKWGP